MKSRALVFAACLLFLNMTPTAGAQTCSPWLAVKLFKGNYTLSAQGTVPLQNGGSWSLNHTMQASFTISQMSATCSSQQVSWGGAGSSSQGSVNDSFVENNCNPGSQSGTIIGSGSGGVANFYEQRQMQQVEQ
jgi:hypothetical protein